MSDETSCASSVCVVPSMTTTSRVGPRPDFASRLEISARLTRRRRRDQPRRAIPTGATAARDRVSQTSGRRWPPTRGHRARVDPEHQGLRALSAVEHRPADVVPQPLVVEYELANRLRELVALPPGLESPCALALSF